MTFAIPPLRLGAVQRALEAVGAAPAELAEVLPRVLAASDFVVDFLVRRPQWLSANAAAIATPPRPATLRQRVGEAVRGCAGEPELMTGLRRVRTEALVLIAIRDVAGWATLEETLQQLSELAEACCQAALDWADRALRARLGMPCDEAGDQVYAFVLGMGKLGGRELNFSSDVDLILGYTARGETLGPRAPANEEYFAQLAKDFTRILAQPTADGFVYRVDWALRPFGLSGPPAMPSDTLEEYYQTHGREWERYALIKARPVAGDLEAGGLLLEALRPFVYRRYLDFNAVGALRDLKQRIAEDVRKRGAEGNIKLGPGGIRELEFIVQAFQLTRGGQDARLRDSRFRPTLAYLGESGLLSPETAATLDRDYVFLRRLENALQLFADAQTHTLPERPEVQAAACAALGYPEWPALAGEIASVRARVEEHFERVFAEARSPVEGGSPAARAALAIWEAASDAEGEAELAAAGFTARPQMVAGTIRDLRGSRLAKTLSESSLKRLGEVVAALLALAAQRPNTEIPETVALRVLRVLGAIAGRSTYVSLLRESGDARAHLVKLCAASPWIPDLLTQSPALLDQLLDPRTLFAPPDRAAMRALADELFAGISPEDTEGGMNALRRFRQETMLRVAAADLVSALPLVKVSDHLTWLAEIAVQKTLERVRAEMILRYGEPRRADGRPVGVAVVAYGKFGGIEMGYGSDVDLVFLHDCDALQADTIGGDRSVANEVWLSRLVQRIVNWLSAQTPAGRAYEVDLELRPDGRRGLMVTSLPAFEQYQRDSAWTWEHQALLRARPVAGEQTIQAEFARIRGEVLTRPRDAAKLRADVLEMRVRMRAHVEKHEPGRFDVKQVEGGLTDIEFLTQYLVLRYASRQPALIEYTDNWRQTEALVAAGVLETGPGQELIEAYRAYRAWLHARDLQQAEYLAEDESFGEQRRAVRALWQRHFDAGETA